jgi:endonuclease/exonuclease/phosphatase family metal-dependent hydrolase
VQVDLGHWLPLPAVNLAITTWNSAGLFGSIHAHPFPSIAKLRRFKGLLRRGDVVAIQESHGCGGDLATLDRECPSHLHWGSFGARAAMGGVVISIAKTFSRHFHTFKATTLSIARCLAVRCRGPAGALQIINLHLDPALPFIDKAALLDSILLSSSTFRGVSIFVGDLNFVHSDETRCNLADPGQTETIENPRLATFFEERFAEFTELHQGAPTRRDTRSNRYTTLSRLDRIYVNLPPAEVLDRHPHCAADGLITDPREPSDHIPVTARLRAPGTSPPSRRSTPRWITAHPRFRELTSDFLDILPVFGSALAGLSSLQELLRDAADETKNAAKEVGAHSNHEIVYWLLLALRGARSCNPRAVRKACAAYPTMAAWFHNELFTLIDPDPFHNHIFELTNRTIAANMFEIQNDPLIAPFKKAGRLEAVRRAASAWAPRRRKVSTFSVLNPDGTAAGSNDAAGQLLLNHWSGVFREKPCSHEAQQTLLAYVVPCPTDVEWNIDRGQFIDIALRARDSAPGPDGLPYSAWSNADPRTLNLIFDAYSELVAGRPLPEGFNRSLMVLIPKGELDGDHLAIARAPEATRPITLSNSIAKIFAMCLNRGLSQLAQSTVLPRQRGFVRGRHLIDNILETESFMMHSTKWFDDKAGLLLLDFAAAFPSVAHRWIFAVLKAMGIPTFIFKAIQELYVDCSVEMIFGGEANLLFAVTAGIKQGCPASGSLFALALDPFVRFLCLRLPRPLHLVTAFADDIAIATRRLPGLLATILVIMDLLDAAACLRLNLEKTVAVPLWPRGLFETKRLIVDSVPRLTKILVQTSGKYLGVHLGPGGAAVRWNSAKAKYWARCLDAKATNGGFFEALRHYHVYGVSVLCYLLQLLPTNTDLLNLERRAAQNITRGPWHAIPGTCLAALKDIGFPAEVRSLKLISQASMFRVSEACVNFQDLARGLADAPDDLDALLHPRSPEWHSVSIMSGLIANRSLVQSLVPRFSVSSVVDLQARLFSSLRALQPSPWDLLFRRRLGRHLHSDEIRHRLVQHHFRTANRLLPAKMVWSALKVVCNGLPQSRRLQEEILPCRLCGGDAGDCLEHLFHCAPLVIFLTIHFPAISCLLGPVFGVARSLFNLALSDYEIIATVVGHDLLTHCISALHLGGRDVLPNDLLTARLRAICRKAPRVAALLHNSPLLA